MRRTTMRRSLSALALVATAGFVLAACGGGNDNSSAGGKSPGEGKAECAGLTKFGDLTGKKVHVYTSIVAPEDKPQKDSYKLFTTCTGDRAVRRLQGVRGPAGRPGEERQRA
jgi:alpha-glucoside transport system substrate-binding protein